ncbi:T9SS type A sorting domain-containing protein [Corallococcus exiguus]|uniref:T9SS type A sorting domain-containing protein n=1 Tax=Corallococcus TaxID=83461 RepID=UPI0011C431C2|nr:T9SS type A sorting domain-containing protein [Corallococcus sp. AB032C]NPC52059.1 T9SS type A sorting domain-containing protein [Corallococcus exiguus]
MKHPSIAAWLCLASLPAAAAPDVAPAPESLSSQRLSHAAADLASRGRFFEGGQVYLYAERGQQDGSPFKRFVIEVERSGEYFLAAHALAVNAVPADLREATDKAYPLQRIRVALDDKGLGELDLQKNGWQPARVRDLGAIYLSAGRHTLTFSSAAPHFPEVDAVKLAPDARAATFEMGRYDAYVAGLKQQADLRVGRHEKVDPAPVPLGPPTLPGPVQGAASTTSSSWERTPYVFDNPSGNYGHTMNVPVVYTYYRTITLNAGTNVTFNTGPIAGQDYYAVDPVMYLFCTTDNTVAWSNDDDVGLHPRISVTIPKTCDYQLVLRSYSSYYASTPSASAGTVNVYQNGLLLQEGAPVSGYIASVGTSQTGTLNYFTGYSTGTPRLWLSTEGFKTPLRFTGGQYWYLPPMDFNWFDDARFRIVKNTSAYMDMYLLVGAEGAWWIYWGNADLYGSVKHPSNSPFANFPNLKQGDAMQTAPSTNVYNCASWAGGMTNGWTWGCLFANNSGGSCINGTWYSSPYSWYTWDSFFGNSPLRYTGAITFTRTDADGYNGEVAVWSTNGDISGATHFSARREANRHPHGYDWESKPGGLERIFHPRDALSGAAYGSIIGYYRDAAKDPYMPWFAPGTAQRVSTPSLTLDESVALGLTVQPHVQLTREESDRLAQLQAGNATARARFDSLYADWMARVGSPELAAHSDLDVFFAQPQYTRLENWLRTHEDVAVPALMRKIAEQREDDRDAMLAALALGRLTGERHGGLMEEVKQEWRQQSYTLDGAYVAPSSLANAKNYVRKLLQRQYGVAVPEVERNALALRGEDSHERFHVSPNPMVEASQLQFELASPATVSAMLLDVRGQPIRELSAAGLQSAGRHALALPRGNLAPGVYSVQLKVGDRVLTRKVAIQ